MQALERLMPVLTAVLVVVLLVVAVGVWRIAGSASDNAEANEKRACVEAAQARYPAVSVSAFVTRDRSASGPLKLSFVRERQRAVAACD